MSSHSNRYTLSHTPVPASHRRKSRAVVGRQGCELLSIEDSWRSHESGRLIPGLQSTIGELHRSMLRDGWKKSGMARNCSVRGACSASSPHHWLLRRSMPLIGSRKPWSEIHFLDFNPGAKGCSASLFELIHVTIAPSNLGSRRWSPLVALHWLNEPQSPRANGKHTVHRPRPLATFCIGSSHVSTTVAGDCQISSSHRFARCGHEHSKRCRLSGGLFRLCG